MQTLVRTRLIYFVTEMKLFISIVLVLNMFLEKLKTLSGKKHQSQHLSKQANNSIMGGYFCIGFIDLMLAGKKVTDFTNLFSPYDLEKNEGIILSYFKDERK